MDPPHRGAPPEPPAFRSDGDSRADSTRLFRLEIEARPEDIDELGHVSNIAYVRWLQLVAAEHSAARGWDHAAYRALGSVFVVKRHEIDYRAPAYAGDRIELCTWVEWWRTASTLRRTDIVRLSDGVLLASAATLWALVGIDSGRPRRIPDELKRPFSAHQSGEGPNKESSARSASDDPRRA